MKRFSALAGNSKFKFTKLLTLAIGISLFIWSLKTAYDKQKYRAGLSVEGNLSELVSEINDQLNTSSEVLYSISNLINTFDDLTASEFERFTSDLKQRKKGILLVEWQPRVFESEREAFILKTRKLGVPNFQMVEPDANNQLIRAKSRPEHYPVLFAVSTREQEKTIGLDLSWSSDRMKSKLEARDLGELRASNTFEVMVTEGEQTLLLGFAITMPVFRDQNVPKTLEGRRKNLEGFLAAVIYLDELFVPVLGELKNRELTLQVVDSSTGAIITNNLSPNRVGLVRAKEIDVFGQKWRVSLAPTDKFLNEYFNISYFLIPVGLFVFILLLLYSQRRNERVNNELVNTRNSLQKALDAARVAAKSKMIFLANMSHELRTPMNAILGYARLVKEERDPKLRQKYIDRMMRSGGHLLNIIDDILEVSSLEESKVKLTPHEFGLDKLISEVKDTISAKEISPEVIFEINLEEGIGHIFGDSYRLRQVLLNLIGNALKFTEKGKVALSCRKKSSDKFGNIILEFIVEDTGIGMDPSYLPDAYRPFSQEDPSFSRKKGGVGLGLSITYSLVQLMNGQVKVETQKGKGTRFVIELPFQVAKKEETSLGENKIDRSLQDHELKKVLVAEDDQDSSFLIQSFLSEERLSLKFVSNGKELLDEFSRSRYDLVLTDIQMPELDGLSATKELRRRGAEVPILALSAHALPEEKEKAVLAGVNGILAKPFDKESLTSFVLKNLH